MRSVSFGEKESVSVVTMWLVVMLTGRGLLQPVLLVEFIVVI